MKRGAELFIKKIESSPEERENIFAGVFAFGEERVFELLLEAEEQNKRLVFYNDPEADDKTAYKFE